MLHSPRCSFDWCADIQTDLFNYSGGRMSELSRAYALGRRLRTISMRSESSLKTPSFEVGIRRFARPVAALLTRSCPCAQINSPRRARVPVARHAAFYISGPASVGESVRYSSLMSSHLSHNSYALLAPTTLWLVGSQSACWRRTQTKFLENSSSLTNGLTTMRILVCADLAPQCVRLQWERGAAFACLAAYLCV